MVEAERALAAAVLLFSVAMRVTATLVRERFPVLVHEEWRTDRFRTRLFRTAWKFQLKELLAGSSKVTHIFGW